MTGFPYLLHLAIICFCARNTFSVGISMPRSPRATIIPSEACMISSKFDVPCWFSIFEMMRISLPFSPRIPAKIIVDVQRGPCRAHKFFVSSTHARTYLWSPLTPRRFVWTTRKSCRPRALLRIGDRSCPSPKLPEGRPEFRGGWRPSCCRACRRSRWRKTTSIPGRFRRRAILVRRRWRCYLRAWWRWLCCRSPSTGPPYCSSPCTPCPWSTWFSHPSPVRPRRNLPSERINSVEYGTKLVH